MAIRLIVQYPAPVLKTEAEKVNKFHSRLHQLIDDMIETMIDADGAGLAAPQVGILKRVIVVHTMDSDQEIIEMVNPEIISQSGEQTTPLESCLSIPHLAGEVKRAAYVKVRGQDRNGEWFEVEAEGYAARAFQHEIDHLNGILFIDRANKIYQGSKQIE